MGLETWKKESVKVYWEKYTKMLVVNLLYTICIGWVSYLKGGLRTGI